MSLNEVNWRNVFTDHKSFPPDLELRVTNKNGSSSVQEQKFLCHKLLLAAVSPVFQSQFFGEGTSQVAEKLVVVINDSNPVAFQKMLEFVYYQKPFKLNSSKQVVDTEGIQLVMDTMALAVKFKLDRLAKFCEETANKSVMVTSQNYREVQKLMMAHTEFGKINRDYCEKFGSIVLTKLSRDHPEIDPVRKREMVLGEVDLFKQGLVSNVMNNKRASSGTEAAGNRKDVKILDEVVLLTTPTRAVDPQDVELQANASCIQLFNAYSSPRHFTPFHSVPGISSFSQSSTTTPSLYPGPASFVQSISPSPAVESFPSPVPLPFLSESVTGTLSSSRSRSSSDIPPSFPPTPFKSTLFFSELWKPRSTSTPVPEDVLSTNMLRKILTSVSKSEFVDDKPKQELELTKEELKTLVLKFKELSEPEKEELFDYIKRMQLKNPKMIKWVREETREVNL
eukprot:GFUD01045630.1.p1 GENE.GFUD01045630.1~~GFUD01045630.1.p1  ORF type:complete len:452 (-),score=122.32 GFUD01045630.1:52-1407(-)